MAGGASGRDERALRALDISDGDVQAYLEAHLLSLPGWAGMMLWRSQQSQDEQGLLLEYLAIRLSMEWMLIEPYLPLSKPNLKRDAGRSFDCGLAALGRPDA
ncbi:Na-translocating system protein MpsB [Bacillus licheniformis]|nr:Na-translocating system protein MpsB [Bacillus licheniformis]